MLPSLITVTVVVVLASVDPSSAGWMAPNLPTLVHMYGIFRHGARSPLYEEYTMFLKTAEHEEKFKGVLRGGLTHHGMKKMYEVGQWLAVRYRIFLSGGYKEEDIWISARGASRAVMTALCMMAGMFMPAPQIFHDLKWQPVPIWGIYEDKSYMFHDLELKKFETCPKYQLLAQRLLDNVLAKEDPNNELYKLLGKATGERNLKSILAAFKIYDQLHCEDIHGIGLPTWATRENPTLNYKPIYPKVLREAIDVWKGTGIADELLKLHIGPMFRNINEQFLKKFQNAKGANKVTLHVSEDTTLYAILRTLGINFMDMYEPGNGILIELHIESGIYVVRFYHYNAATNDIVEVNAPKCGEVPCSLASFQTLFPGLTHAQWVESCKDV